MLLFRSTVNTSPAAVHFSQSRSTTKRMPTINVTGTTIITIQDASSLISHVEARQNDGLWTPDATFGIPLAEPTPWSDPYEWTPFTQPSTHVAETPWAPPKGSGDKGPDKGKFGVGVIILISVSLVGVAVIGCFWFWWQKRHGRQTTPRAIQNPGAYPTDPH